MAVGLLGMDTRGFRTRWIWIQVEKLTCGYYRVEYPKYIGSGTNKIFYPWISSGYPRYQFTSLNGPHSLEIKACEGMKPKNITQPSPPNHPIPFDQTTIFALSYGHHSSLSSLPLPSSPTATQALDATVSTPEHLAPPSLRALRLPRPA
jgi:hypothetical protein